MPNPKEDEIRDQQRASWNKFSAGWKKWDSLTMKMLAPAGDAMIAGVGWKETFNVLDVASGTGEPGLTVAGLVKQGKVVAVDLAEAMSVIAGENAKARGIKNFFPTVGSAERIDAPDSAFDIVLCRFGFMFFPNIAAALTEFRRVLKPGGRLVAAVWAGPETNSWASTIMGIINANVDLPKPPPEAPGLFRCAKPGGLEDAFRTAEFRDVSEKTIAWEGSYGSLENYWSFMTEVAAPVVAGLAKADPPTREKIRAAVFEALGKNVSQGELKLSLSSRILTAMK